MLQGVAELCRGHEYLVCEKKVTNTWICIIREQKHMNTHTHTFNLF